MTFLAILAVLVGLFVMRRRRKTTLAGLNSAAPAYSLTPASRWSTNAKDHRL